MAIAPTNLRPSPIEADRPEPPRAKPPAPWRWMVAACLILAASGAVRVAQEHRFGIASRNASKAPFPLRELPKELGRWTMQGDELALDKETLQIAGSVDYIARNYANDTGVLLEALVVFGPAERVFPHDPTVCFPSFGFSPAEGARQHLIPTGSGTAVFDSLIYYKPAEEASRTEVFYSFWHDGRWSPAAAQTSKRFRHHPEMFKIQVQRLVGSSERRIATSDTEPLPIEDFLGQLVPEIERRIADAAPPTAAAAKDDPSTGPSS